MKQKFKPDQKAIIIGNHNSHKFKIGQKVVIQYLYDDHTYKCKNINGTDWWWVLPVDLKPAESGNTAHIRATRNGGFRTTLVGKNGEVMFTSEVYTTKAMAKKTLKQFPDFEIVDHTKKK